jgi:sterol desaturase/sphingolipid hydroxylase (fatty acid hydroxylase superfamily)
MQLVRLSVWLVLLSVLFVPLERLFALHPQKICRKAILSDVGFYFLSSLTPSLFLSIPLAVMAWSVHRFIPSEITSISAHLPLWARALLSLVIGEVGFYWGHRWSHELPFLWRFHTVHHSAEEMDFLVNTKTHPVDMVFTRLCGLIPLYILGLAAPVRGAASMIPLLILLLGTVWGFFIHANLRWRFGVLESLVATPAFHHWHHTNDGPAYINKNYASMLPWMDRLFGTLYLPKDKRPERYGIDDQLPAGMIGQLLQPMGLWETKEKPLAPETAHEPKPEYLPPAPALQEFEKQQ